ncbi:putative fad-binding monooxygenase protein [Phaeoacremonium minimum UCRPA7]|uniref:Putative fad-binding monooxygenase protein n=1 Tax=Phaeoacremonium minimum (strain UCR-PA7) TaxID=1286976 RepID=R8B9X8_PHAM7|nr:putative fad-binding monooxygenase protein [Phaeoacremonium minimum UCRPA7]EON96098.1 putative fad-binding monooxygenase protein [Phaeoacremonium minimum UCRPA7]
MADHEDITERYPVAVVGGGAIGLSASILLSQRNISHVLFERHPGTSIHPKACGINQRTTEIFRVMGIEQAVRAIACPDDVKGRTAWYTGLGEDGREICSRDAWGGGVYADEYATFSPTRYEILPQIRLEPVLVARAKELNPAALRYRSEVTSLREVEDGVILTVQTEEQAVKKVFARFVIAADGGRSITDQLGVPWLGKRDILKMVSVHFRAPIRSLHPDPRNFMTWLTHPEKGGSVRTGYLYQIGPWPFDSPEARKSEEWVFGFAIAGSDPTKFDQAASIARLRSSLRISNLPIEVITVSHWNVQCLSAERYRVGRVFLAGDAAHKIPPFGALGMNTGIQDIYNLVWKLGFALKDEQACEGLLQSYDTERRPIGRRVGESSLHNMLSHGLVMDVALGMSPVKSQEENAAAISPFFDKTHPEHAEKVKAVDNAQKVLDLEFKAPGAEVGWFYPSVDIDEEGKIDNHGGQLLENGDLNSEFFFPSIIPGHHIPHVWLEKAGIIIAIRDLIPQNNFLLISSEAIWETLASENVNVELIGDSHWRDITNQWPKYSAGYGAVLVRPDGIIVWRGNWQQNLLQNWPNVLARALFQK